MAVGYIYKTDSHEAIREVIGDKRQIAQLFNDFFLEEGLDLVFDIGYGANVTDYGRMETIYL